MIQSDLMPIEHRQSGSLIERPADCYPIIGGRVADQRLRTNYPDAQHPFLAPHDFRLGGTADDHDNVTVALDGAEQQDRCSGKAGGDGDEMVGQIDDQRIGTPGFRRQQQGQAEKDQTEEKAPRRRCRCRLIGSMPAARPAAKGRDRKAGADQRSASANSPKRSSALCR